jgi:hypothetical protein
MAPLLKIATIESLHADAGQRTEWGLYYSDIRRLRRGRRHGRGLKYMALGESALMLWGFALENLAKSIVIHREQASLPTDRLAPALSKHKTLELLLRSGIPLTTREAQLVKRLEMAVNWSGRYPVPKVAAQMDVAATASNIRGQVGRLFRRVREKDE